MSNFKMTTNAFIFSFKAAQDQFGLDFATNIWHINSFDGFEVEATLNRFDELVLTVDESINLLAAYDIDEEPRAKRAKTDKVDLCG